MVIGDQGAGRLRVIIRLQLYMEHQMAEVLEVDNWLHLAGVSGPRINLMLTL